MYKQEKHYLVLIKNMGTESMSTKKTEAGMQKITLTEKKIRVDYYLNTLPICYGITMECRLRYRQRGETISTQIWKEELSKNNSHYTFQISINRPVEAILDCTLYIPGGYLVIAEINEEVLTVGEINAAEAAKNEKEAEDNGNMERKPANFRKIKYIRDLEYLKTQEGELSEMYYNSFLLHGFYQHHYFILGENFIGVPDHFYEREAIAAKMMGFPYFIEGENVENCDINGEVRKELPEVGSFGYFLKKFAFPLSLLPSAPQKE